jgi:hypothetical protein
MPSRRQLLACGAVLALSLPSRARAQDRSAAYGRLLVDLPGWTAEAVQTMSMSQGGMAFAWASREYQRGETRLNAVLGVSPASLVPDATGNAASRDMEMRNGNALLRSRMVRGMRVVSAYDSEEKSGMVFVMLAAAAAAGGSSATPASPGASFLLTFEGITLDEASTLADRFDWPAMQRMTAGR